MKVLAAAALALLLGLPAPAGATDGAEIYRRRCASCHGADGGGGARQLPPLWAPEIQAKGDAELFDAVAKGSADRKMPAYRGKLADDEIRSAVAHLRTLKR